VNWLWLGGLVMALGGAAAAWPIRRQGRGDNEAASGTRKRTAVDVGAR
jgi:cytochrome c biogenesis factor